MIKMLDAGAYKDLDCSLMAHPGNNAYGAWARTLASWRANVTWTGSESAQLMVTDRIHHVIKNTDNLVTNVIPDRVESEWGVRDYWDQNPSFQLAKNYYGNLIEYFDPSKDETTSKFSIHTPEEEVEAGGSPSASSDQGNVSWFLPSIQVGFPIGGSAPKHNPGFTKVAGTDFAFDQAIITAKALALTGLEVLQNATFAENMKKEWEEMFAKLQF
ncbi:unnamed protein product [Clonostachys byssicola]|uniref:Uncharacterized protein n=1 Tax=Clonostachys byssicola TaxID=160290 RepID=A0A9N9Y9U5_9HYPO|nr:unnamed protein product [Clonostachys byssicola]